MALPSGDVSFWCFMCRVSLAGAATRVAASQLALRVMS